MHARRIAPLVALCLAMCAHVALPAAAFSQAWVPRRGEGTVSFTYQNLVGRDHINFRGVRNRKVGTDSAHSTSTEFEYGLTDRLAFNADVVYVASKYEGAFPEGPSDFDTSYHPTFQDAHFQVRYNALRNPLALTPFVSVTLPTHRYETSGHNAAGRHFRELLIGVSAGRQLGPLLPNVYLQGRYSYAILKRFAGLNLDRSNLDWEVGWAATRRLTLRFLGAWQKTHGGLNGPGDFGKPGTEEFELHDRVLRAGYSRLGGGATFSLSRTFDVSVAYAGTVRGVNALAVKGVAVGFAWRFSRGSDISKISPDSSARDVPATGRGTF